MGVEEMRAELLDQALPIPQRFRALFALRSVGGDAAVDALLEGLKDPSALFRHEVAFALGQMQVTRAVATLKRVLRDESEHSMVRHEAAEALGAIASDECLKELKQASEGECQVVRETAVLALHRLQHAQAARAAAADKKKRDDENTPANVTTSPPKSQQPQASLGSAKEKLSAPAATIASASAEPAGDALNSDSPYLSVDPVPAASSSVPTETLRATLLDEGADMWAGPFSFLSLSSSFTYDPGNMTKLELDLLIRASPRYTSI